MSFATQPANVFSALDEFGPAQVEQLLEVCARFREWEREEIVLVEPSPETLEVHRKAVTKAIKLARCLLAMGTDPEVVSAKNFSRLSILHKRLTDSWDMFHNKPGSGEMAELDAIQAKRFPG